MVLTVLLFLGLPVSPPVWTREWLCWRGRGHPTTPTIVCWKLMRVLLDLPLDWTSRAVSPVLPSVTLTKLGA